MGHMHALEQASASGRASCSLSAGRRGTIIAYSPLKQPLYSASHIAQPFDKETLALATHPTVDVYRDSLAGAGTGKARPGWTKAGSLRRGCGALGTLP